MATIKIAMREIQKRREHEMDNIYRLAEFNAGHQEQQRNPSNIKSEILPISGAP